ncbi:MAG: ABC transporter substrate-binding protein [Atopobiaceae bacterium]|nr:ABC transporter substrate-binding protein [Atopobiaceae bacterium]MCH4181192.1 ABC transporter substrate-binding protein [Atopobiaceae bacterium]MCH4214957.1 ABC transporter substrate-binding protein [Atopobiaceae bacterium]MCH4277108.1 ABC transporter substrate-binding protein [Atopobiaceae bacterium]MCI1227261.1 ABC transporter substrate-binding protein [Atopobiaceae bacterium]
MSVSHMDMSRRQFLRTAGLGAVALAGLGISGCSTSASASSATTAATTGELTQLSFVLDYTPNTNHTGIYVAQSKGYFADEGLSVEVVQPPEDGADAIVGTGQAQVGMSYQDTMANYLGSSDPLPVTAVAAVIQHNTSGIMSRAGEGITHPAGMMDKRYATWDQDVEKAIIKSVVTTDGGDFSRVSLVPCNSTDEVSGLKADEFDDIWVYEAWAVQNAKVQGFDYDYFAFKDIDARFDYYTPVVIANDDFLKDSPDTAKAFLRAVRKGYEYAEENPDDAAQILCAAAPEVDADLAKASQEYLADKYTAEASSWGVIDPDRWNSFYQWLGQESLTEVAIPDGTGFSMDYLA